MSLKKNKNQTRKPKSVLFRMISQQPRTSGTYVIKEQCSKVYNKASIFIFMFPKISK